MAQLVETCTAPTNIAVIKYWGKASVALNTPINSSVSVTLNQDDLCAKTSALASKDFSRDRLWLNGVEEDVSASKRIQTCLREVRRLAQDRIVDGEVVVRKEDWPQYKVHIVSANTFPTAAGLASSAAGYACLVATLAKLFCARETYPGELSAIARQGSGSACRSLFGGFVRWNMGANPYEEGQDSFATQVADEAHWPDLESVILVVSDRKKDTSSTAGMSTSVATSPLLKFRAESVVDGRLAAIEEAYRQRDFETFAQITMADSNQFHATCQDTYPPIFYMNDTSRNIVRLIHYYNDQVGVRACYTFDAGPNAVLFVRREHVAHLVGFLEHFLPASVSALCSKRAVVEAAAAAAATVDAALVDGAPVDRGVLDVKMVYHTTVGDGPRTLSVEEALVDVNSGEPKSVASSSSGGSSGSAGGSSTARYVMAAAAAGVAVVAWLRS